VYDLGGNGKTAIKVALNKYLLGQTLNGIGRNPNPVLALTSRSTGRGPMHNGDFVPQCDLLNPLATTAGIVRADLGSHVRHQQAGELYDKD
jgi:hypothetical protein